MVAIFSPVAGLMESYVLRPVGFTHWLLMKWPKLLPWSSSQALATAGDSGAGPYSSVSKMRHTDGLTVSCLSEHVATAANVHKPYKCSQTPDESLHKAHKLFVNSLSIFLYVARFPRTICVNSNRAFSKSVKTEQAHVKLILAYVFPASSW